MTSRTQRVLRAAVAEAHGVADRPAERHLQLVGDPLGHGAGGEPARLRVGDRAAHAAAELQAELRDLRRLARAGLPRHDHDLVVADRRQQVLAAAADRQLGRIADRGYGGMPLRRRGPPRARRRPRACAGPLGSGCRRARSSRRLSRWASRSVSSPGAGGGRRRSRARVEPDPPMGWDMVAAVGRRGSAVRGRGARSGSSASRTRRRAGRCSKPSTTATRSCSSGRSPTWRSRERVRVEGTWQHDKRFGPQVRVATRRAGRALRRGRARRLPRARPARRPRARRAAAARPRRGRAGGDRPRPAGARSARSG